MDILEEVKALCSIPGSPDSSEIKYLIEPKDFHRQLPATARELFAQTENWERLQDKLGAEWWAELTCQLLLLPVKVGYIDHLHGIYINDTMFDSPSNEWLFSVSDTPFGIRVNRIWLKDTIDFLTALRSAPTKEE